MQIARTRCQSWPKSSCSDHAGTRAIWHTKAKKVQERINFDTICDATQERQDAITELLEEKLDMVLIVGGFDSSNTAHVKEIPHHQGVKSFHMDRYAT